MPYFSNKSKNNLSTCHEDLQMLFNEVIKSFDCTIIEGHRSKEKQNQYVTEGKSKTVWPNSQHNSNPSMAVDVAPYPINWKDIKRFYYFGGFVKGIAQKLIDDGAISHWIRWGGDWNNNTLVHDQTFFDLVHFELRPFE